MRDPFLLGWGDEGQSSLTGLLFAFKPRQNPTIENNPQARFNNNFFFAGFVRAGVIPLRDRILAIVRDDTQMAVRPLATVRMVIFG
jgi:hypothetical protein